MPDEFTNNVAQKFPNTQMKEPVERPWDVTEQKVVSPIKRQGEEQKRDEVTERIHNLYSELRSSLTIRSALEYDLRKAQRVLEELNRVKGEVEKMIEMLQAMEGYMRERIK
jgi:predicted transcriptional regulator